MRLTIILFQAVIVLVFIMQAASVSADMVVFGSGVFDRSTLRALVLPQKKAGEISREAQIRVEFFWGMWSP